MRQTVSGFGSIPGEVNLKADTSYSGKAIQLSASWLPHEPARVGSTRAR
jgi:hypothetical protein